MYRLGDERLENSPTERDLKGLVDSKLNMSQQCALVASRANLRCTKHGIASRLRKVIAPICSALMWFYVEYCV